MESKTTELTETQSRLAAAPGRRQGGQDRRRAAKGPDLQL